MCILVVRAADPFFPVRAQAQGLLCPGGALAPSPWGGAAGGRRIFFPVKAAA